jgi:NAD-dependent SIR2 family protein deacetylase
MRSDPDLSLTLAARALASADALVIAAGAGMGVDSGLPDFRGPDGFWNAYPPYRRLRLDFVSLANPRWFADDPALAWGFYGHRLALYRGTEPHHGFAILRRWANRMARGYFVFTSNVDAHFRRAGFDAKRIVEVHGAIDALQCTRECGAGIFPAQASEVVIDLETMRAADPLPACPGCGALARPNILMFGDWGWNSSITDAQHARMSSWLAALGAARPVIVELGAGRAVPTVRITCEQIARQLGGTLIRINPREPEVPRGHISIPASALTTLAALDQLLDSPD